MCDDIVLQEAEPFEDLTGIDETLPQHYDTPTAALDWTNGPLNVAIFFAIENYNSPMENSILYKAKQVPSTCFSIYAYKQNVENKAPVYLNKERIKENVRQQRQRGVFTYFSQLCSFYLKNDRFPSVEDYYHEKDTCEFELLKYNVKINETAVAFLSKKLEKRNITRFNLFPDEDIQK